MGDIEVRTDRMVEIVIDGTTANNIHRYTFYSKDLYEQFIERDALPSGILYSQRKYEDQLNTDLACAMKDLTSMFIIGEKSEGMEELRPGNQYNQVHIPGIYHRVVMDACKYYSLRSYTRIIPSNDTLLNAPPSFTILDPTDTQYERLRINEVWGKEISLRFPWFESILRTKYTSQKMDLYAGEVAGFAEGFSNLRSNATVVSCHD